ncbi:IS30 family transposase [Marispirochaeta aestuarii]|uniref:IS30 family transposase n=1 Tax=Marispirochaeta aestuarii TaxID=1963862 RepID=UPI0029C7AA82|nr:IS30 family transposase [Marispirochaeta aestuarii]
MGKYHQLSQEERYTITFLLKRNNSLAEIARQLKRSKSTISRELRRNRSNHDDGYRAEVAHRYATARRKRERRRSHFSDDQWKVVFRHLRRDWSPEQIVDHLKRFHTFTMSHETIYQYLLWDKKHGGLLYKHLRIITKRVRKRYGSRDFRGILPGKRHISTRPAAVETREELGHWEGDTVIGKDRYHCILTLVERKSGFVIIKKLRSRTVKEVTAAAIRSIRTHHKLFKTITFDNGVEFHGYKKIEEVFPVICYFATPYHSWERGSNENANGLIRQYIPKKTSMKNLTQYKCDWIAKRLNTRPRKRLGFKTPEEVFNAA